MHPGARFLVSLLPLLLLAAAVAAQHAGAYVGEGPPPYYEALWSSGIHVYRELVNGPAAILFTSDGSHIVYSTSHGVSVLDAGTGEPLRTLYRAKPHFPPAVIALSPDEKLLIVGDTVGNLYLVNTSNGRVVAETRLPARLEAAAFSPDGGLVAVAYGGTVGLLKLAGLHPVWRRGVSEYGVYYRPGAVVFSPDGKLVTVASYTRIGGYYAAGKITVLRASDGRVLWSTAIDGITAVGYADRSLVLGLSSGSVVELDARSGSTRWRARLGPPIVDLRVHGSIVAVLLGNGTVVWLDAGTGAAVWRGSVRTPFQGRWWGLLSPNARDYVVVGEDKLTYMGHPRYGLIRVVGGSPGVRVRITGAGGKCSCILEHGEGVVYATPGAYTLYYDYPRLPYTRIIFNESNRAEGRLTLSVQPGGRETVRIRPLTSFYATLVLVGSKYRDAWIKLGKPGDVPLSIHVARGKTIRYLVDPGRYVITLPSGETRTVEVKAGDTLTVEVEAAGLSSPTATQPAPGPEGTASTSSSISRSSAKRLPAQHFSENTPQETPVQGAAGARQGGAAAPGGPAPGVWASTVLSVVALVVAAVAAARCARRG